MANEEFRSSADVRTGLIRGRSDPYRALQYYVVDGLALIEGDIVLDTVQGIEQLTQAIMDESRQHRLVAITGDRYRWPDAMVPYVIDPALSTPARVQEAVAHWNQQTNIWLVERTDQANYVTFRPGNGCQSQVGMQGGQQFIDLALGCDRGRVIHEIGHTVGLWHEQSRKDRDLYIRILWQNIDPTQIHNFNQHISDGVDIDAYDYGSIMHYPTWAFSRNGQPTIESLQQAEIGQRNALSDADIRGINALYPQHAAAKP